MRNYYLLLFTALVAIAYANVLPHDISRNEAVKEENHLRIDLNETSSEELMDKWLSQAFSGLMAAVASKKISKLPAEHKDIIKECSKEAKDVPAHAKCIVQLLEAEKTIPVRKTQRKLKKRVKPYQKRSKTTTTSTTTETPEDLEWIGSFGTARAKRSTGFKVVQRDNYSLKSDDDMDGMTKLAKSMTNTVRAMKNKTEKAEAWLDAIERVKNLKVLAKEEKKEREMMKQKLRQFIDNTPDEFVDPRKPVALKEAEMEDERTELAKLSRKKATEEVRVPMKLLREAVKTAMMLGGKNVSDFDQKTLKMVSPRIMSIVPEQEDDSLFNLLSPSLFSLHDEGEGIEKLTSLPHMLKKLDSHGQNAWLDFIVEAAGVSDGIDKTEEEFRNRKEKEYRGENGVPLYFTKENATKIIGESEKTKIEVFEHLDKSYNDFQKKKLNDEGFTILDEHQMVQLYGEGSPYEDRKALENYRRLKDDPEKFERYLETDIRALAEAEKFKAARRADIVGSPFILTPLTFASVPLSNKFIVLSPLVLSPITLSPAVLGPIILSPWVFVPLVLSPRVLSPLILNPLVFSPIILSPLVLHPLILVPGIFNPIILSPLLLSPLILSPQVFTPLILSPFALNPLILTPMVGSPLILSPFVLSPIILSPQALFAVVLSPYALSPLVESKLIAAEVVLSPSWLS